MRLVTLATCNLNQWAMDFEGNLERVEDSIRQVRGAIAQPSRASDNQSPHLHPHAGQAVARPPVVCVELRLEDSATDALSSRGFARKQEVT